MTGYTVHTGTTIKFSESWDRIFQPGPAKSAAGKLASRKKSTKLIASKRTRAKRTAKKK